MMLQRRLTLAAALLAATMACSAPEVTEQKAVPPVVVVGVSVDDLAVEIGATGELKARDEASIASEVAGRITSILVDEGDSVEADQVLLEIDPERRELEVLSARARRAETAAAVAEQERELGRIRQLHSKGIASQAQLDTIETALTLARSRHDAARAGLGVAERALRDASVRAPFAGLVGRRHVSRGEYVQPGLALFELVALDPIEVEFHLAERDSARVHAGQKVRVVVSPYPDESFEGRVSMISPTIDVRTRTLRVEAEVVNDGRLRPGLFARVDLGVDLRRDVLLVPEQAVLQRSDGQIVFRTTTDNRAERVIVETGAHRGGMVEIASGLRREDRVVTLGHAGLVDGVSVSPRSPDGTPVRTELSAAPAEVSAQ